MAFRAIQAGQVAYRAHSGDRTDAYYAHPNGPGKFPGVVVIHHFPGWDEWTTEVCRKFAHHGYAAVAPHLYALAHHQPTGLLIRRLGAAAAVAAPATGPGKRPLAGVEILGWDIDLEAIDRNAIHRRAPQVGRPEIDRE